MKTLSDCKILIVDDTPSNVEILLETLGSCYQTSVALDGETAIEDALEIIPDLILLDIMMPEVDGYEVCRSLKNNPETQNIIIIFLTALGDEQNEAKGLSLGAIDYIAKPFNPELVKARVKNHLQLKIYQDHLENLVIARTQELQLTQDIVIDSMGALAEFRNPETGWHIKRTQTYVKILCERMRKNEKFHNILTDPLIDILYKSSPLHDIGKVGVKDLILLKAGPLSFEEFREMQQHTLYGRDAIRASIQRLGHNSFLKYAEEIAYTHHEKWDGTGYPQGLRGDEIPLSGRIMAVADVYDALVSNRVYKKAMSHEEAKEILCKGRATHFDPDVIDAFINCHEEFKRIGQEHADLNK